jgi:hypothetical protein
MGLKNIFPGLTATPMMLGSCWIGTTMVPLIMAWNGFLALAEFDKSTNGGDGDGIISQGDSIFVSLRLWQDSNHDGISEPGEMFQLNSLGLKKIFLDYKQSKRRDLFGNHFRYRSKVEDTHNAQLGRWAWDIFLVASR